MFKVLLFVFSLNTGEQIVTLRFEQLYTQADCVSMIGPLAAQIKSKAVLFLRQRVRVQGECRLVK